MSINDSLMREKTVKPGLYRHYRGDYFYVTHVARRWDGGESSAIYFNVARPMDGVMDIPLKEFVSETEHLRHFNRDEYPEGTPIVDQPDNVTGQKYRFVRVHDLNFQLRSIDTEQLISELRDRVDSPIHSLDIEGLYSRIASVDYVVGIEHKADPDKGIPAGVETLQVYDTEEELYNNFTPQGRKRAFKRTFIRMF